MIKIFFFRYLILLNGRIFTHYSKFKIPKKALIKTPYCQLRYLLFLAKLTIFYIVWAGNGVSQLGEGAGASGEEPGGWSQQWGGAADASTHQHDWDRYSNFIL